MCRRFESGLRYFYTFRPLVNIFQRGLLWVAKIVLLGGSARAKVVPVDKPATENLAPIYATNETPIGDSPPGMVWIPGGEFFMSWDSRSAESWSSKQTAFPKKDGERKIVHRLAFT